MAKKNISIKKFVITYLVLMLFLVIPLWFKPVVKYFDFASYYSVKITYISAYILNLLGIVVGYSGTIIRTGNIALDVQFGCNGLEAVIIYVVAIISFPGTFRSKLIGIIAGFLVIQVLNLLRIIGLVYTAVNYKSLFEIVHLYVAQGIMIAVALGIFILYLKYINYLQSNEEAAG